MGEKGKSGRRGIGRADKAGGWGGNYAVQEECIFLDGQKFKKCIFLDCHILLFCIFLDHRKGEKCIFLDFWNSVNIRLTGCHYVEFLFIIEQHSGLC